MQAGGTQEVTVGTDSAGVLGGGGAGRGAIFEQLDAIFEPTELLKDCLEVAVQSVAGCASITLT
jgi:hypothetical protein